MPTTTCRPAPPSRRAIFRAAAIAALSACAFAAAWADDGIDPFDDFSADTVDAAVDATLPEPLSALQRRDPLATTVLLATRLDTSAGALGDAVRPAFVSYVRSKSRAPVSSVRRPIGVERASRADTSRLLSIQDQSIDWYADGLPSPNGPSDDPFERVLPRQVDPNAVTFGAHWGAQDKLALPLGTSIAISAQADILTGAAGLRANSVRRTLRLVAQWDDIDSIVFGLSPGVEHALGNIYERHITGLQASTLDPSRTARWSSFVEVSGEKISPTNLYENATAQVRAGATWQAAQRTQLDVSVSRGTLDKPDTQANVGLSMKF